MVIKVKHINIHLSDTVIGSVRVRLYSLLESQWDHSLYNLFGDLFCLIEKTSIFMSGDGDNESSDRTIDRVEKPIYESRKPIIEHRSMAIQIHRGVSDSECYTLHLSCDLIESRSYISWISSNCSQYLNDFDRSEIKHVNCVLDKLYWFRPTQHLAKPSR